MHKYNLVSPRQNTINDLYFILHRIVPHDVYCICNDILMDQIRDVIRDVIFITITEINIKITNRSKY